LNGSPRHDFVIAFGRMEAVTYGLKYSVDETRPNGQPHSFPSGHTSASFMGAEFIRKQYGWYAGAPAYLAASYVGWTRQQSRNHYSRDVFAGALIGILSNHDLAEFFVQPQQPADQRIADLQRRLGLHFIYRRYRCQCIGRRRQSARPTVVRPRNRS